MGNLSGLYNQETAPDAPEFSLIPAGDYEGDIVKAELKETKSGHMISLQIKLDNDRYVFDNLNIQCHTSQKAEEIAQGALKKIGQTNNKVITDTEDLDMCRVRVRVAVQEARGDYAARNIVKFYQDLSGSVATQPATRAPATRAPAGASSRPPVARPAATTGGNRWGGNRLQKAAEAPTNDYGLDDEIPFN